MVELDFMVVPEELSRRAVVHDPVRIRIVDPEAIFLTGILGESGRKLVAAGVEFYFTRTLAEKLIALGVAEEVCKMTEMSMTLERDRRLNKWADEMARYDGRCAV